MRNSDPIFKRTANSRIVAALPRCVYERCPLPPRELNNLARALVLNHLKNRVPEILNEDEWETIHDQMRVPKVKLRKEKKSPDDDYAA